MITINNQFELGQIVYLKTDPEQLQRMVVGITVNPGNSLFYRVAFEEDASSHYEIELSADKDIMMVTS